MKRTLVRIKNYIDAHPKAFSFLFRSSVIFLILFALYYISVVVVLPVLNHKYIIPDKKSKSGLVHDLSWHYLVHDTLYDRSVELANKESFLLARSEMAKGDSIGLIVDLLDSTVSLNIQGVTIFNARISDYDNSNVFRINDPFVTAQFFSWPFRVKEYSSSIPKIPVIIKKAPRDTIEAAAQSEPGHMEESQNYVSFQLQLDRKVNLLFEQDRGPDTIRYQKIRHYIHQQKRVVKRSVRIILIRGSPAEFVPEINIRLDHKDALVIFRALPENASVAIRINPNN